LLQVIAAVIPVTVIIILAVLRKDKIDGVQALFGKFQLYIAAVYIICICFNSLKHNLLTSFCVFFYSVDVTSWIKWSCDKHSKSSCWQVRKMKYCTAVTLLDRKTVVFGSGDPGL